MRGCGCLLTSDGGPLSAADGSGRRVCLLVSGRWTGRLGHLFSLISSAHPIGSVPGLSAHSISHHLIDVEGLSFPFRLTPSLLLFSVCLLGACSPVPGRGMCWLRYGLRRRAAWAACLRFHLPFRSLAAARSLVAIRSMSLVPLFLSGELWGVLRSISAAYLSALAFLNRCP